MLTITRKLEFDAGHRMPDHKTVVIDRVPTVENLAQTAFDILKGVYNDRFGRHLSLAKITLFETPNCWAEIDG